VHSNKTASILAISLVSALSALGCATETMTDRVEEGATGTAEEEARASKEHFEPSIQGVAWRPGCGIVRPGSTCPPSGLFLTYTRQYIDLTSDVTTHVNNAAGVIVIEVDTYGIKGQAHSRAVVRPEDEQIVSPKIEIGRSYDVTVIDWKHKKLWEGTILTALAQ
jgi:hypothetical protein